MTTLAQFRTAVSGKLGLDNDSVADQPSIDKWVNEGYLETLTRSRAHVDVATMTLTVGAVDYTLPTAILALDDLYITDTSTSLLSRMERLSSAEILAMRIATQNAASPPIRRYALNGGDLLMVYPTPVTADVLTAYYVPRPTTLSAASDTPDSIPAEWHKAIEYYALAQGGQHVNDSPSQNGQMYLALFEQELGRLKRALLKRGGRKLSPAVVGRHRAAIGQPSQQNV